MPYVTVGDVQALAPHVPIDAQSKPNAGQVAQWISDKELALNAVLSSAGYVTPITGAQSLAIVRPMIENAVMAMVMRSRPNPEIDPKQFQDQYDTVLKAILDPKSFVTLPDAQRIDVIIKSSSIDVRSNLTELDEDNPSQLTRESMF